MNNKVILILADGMRPDSMMHIPYVRKLQEKCAYKMNAQTVFPSVTLPCHMSLFLGVSPERHGITTNMYTPLARPVSGLFEQLSAAKKTSAVFYDWEPLRDLWKPGSISFSRFESGAYAEHDLRNTDAAIEYISEKLPDFVFLYLGNPDYAGHTYHDGWMGKEYIKSIEFVWENIERVIEKFSDNYSFVITADHGGHERNHGADIPEDMLIPLMLLGEMFKPGEIKGDVNIMDIAPTVAKLIGIDLSPEWEGKTLV